MEKTEKCNWTIDELSSALVAPIRHAGNALPAGLVHIRILPTHVISTSWHYYKNKQWDEDMSDVAIGFYNASFRYPNGEALYRCSMNRSPSLSCLGDTMNSFNSIANKVPTAGRSRKSRTAKATWPQWLQDYHGFYHCLANFWVLPMGIGRGGCGLRVNRGANAEKDFVDRHLHKVKNYHYGKPRSDDFTCDKCGNLGDYYGRFGEGEDGWRNFIKILCLEPYLNEDGDPVKLGGLEPEAFCITATALIRERAKRIAARYEKALVSFFDPFVQQQSK
ncbi:MAG: hypothetical protein LBD12_03220 [Clostridiales Family XIII bacterium]|jgi:hypothetical protein|nr:hypothetical protein [Clostridiales Family XIII bacterium]